MTDPVLDAMVFNVTVHFPSTAEQSPEKSI
jgi:hypothetical protein